MPSRHAPLLLLAAALGACSGPVALSPPPIAPPPPPEVTVAPAPAAPPPWLIAPGTDPGVVALAREALTCTWYAHGFAGNCAAIEAWEKARAPFEAGKADVTLLVMLEDPDVKPRLLAARKLDELGKAFRADRALAERVVAVAERERYAEGPLAALLGRIVATIDVEGTGLAARVEAIARTHPLRLLRSYLVQSLPRYNRTSAAVRRMVEAAVEDPDGEVRVSAAGAYQFVEEGSAASCAFWAASLAHRDARVVGQFAYGLSQDRCAPYHDALLATLERSDVALTPFSSFASALENLCKGSAAKARVRARAAGVARTIASSGHTMRGCLRDSGPAEALDAVVACDPGSAKRYVGRFLKDDDASLREHAAELYKGLR